MVVSSQEIVYSYGDYHREIADVAQTEQLAQEWRRQLLIEQQGWLAAEETLLP